MFLNKDFLQFYFLLPVNKDKDEHSSSIFWKINATSLEKLYKSDTTTFEKLWKALIFSLFKKIVYQYSRHNYNYTENYIQWKFRPVFKENIIYRENFIYREKFNYFFINTVEGLSIESKNKFQEYSLMHLEHFSHELCGLFIYFEDEVFQYPFFQDLKRCLLEFDLKEEFSDQPGDISATFYQTILQIIRNKQSV